jgi:outer membrane protein assembly factor BamB
MMAWAAHGARPEWPDFRGPRGDGHVVSSGKLPITWSETNNVAWKTPLPHKGISTPVINRDGVWLTAATEDGHDFYVLRVDAKTGEITLNEKVFHSDQPESLGNGASMNSYATPSAVLDADRVYVHFGSFGTAALDPSSGKVLWKREDLRCRHYRGASSSPVLFENLVILTFDGADLQYEVALDKDTGKTVWKTDRSVKWNDENEKNPMVKDGDWRKAHSTPLIVTANEKPLMLCAAAKAAYGYDPRTGKELWKVQYNDWSTAPRALFDNGLAYFVTGLSKKEMLGVKVGGSGDVTDTHIAWRVRQGIGKYSSPIIVDGIIYTASDESFITALDAKSGEVIWTERVGGKFAASPIYGDGHLYFFDQKGTALVLKPGRKLEVLSTNTLENGFMASPAAANGSLFLRSKSHLYRIDS